MATRTGNSSNDSIGFRLPRAANTNNDLLTLDLSYFAEGYGFTTYSFSADPLGGWSGYYYADSANRFDFDSIERFNITGSNYRDILQTGDGADVIRAGGGNDVVISGLGRDTLDGGSGIDGITRNLINSGTAISINLAANTVTASYGTIRGFEYFANFVGTGLADTFVSSTARGDDDVTAGDGDDRGEFMRGYDSFAGGGGNDTVRSDYSWANIGRGLSMSLTPESSGEGYRGYVYLDGANRLNFTTTENFEIVGTAYNDVLEAGNGNDTISGGAGDDDIRTLGGIDTLDGGDGIDGLGRDFSALAADIAIDLGAGTLAGTGGAIVNFEYFANVLGGAGNDSFTTTGVVRTDRVTGGGGNDTARFFAGYDVFAGSLGTDRAVIDYSAILTGDAITTSFGVDTNGGYQGYYYVNSSTRLDFSSVEAFTITGTRFDDTITTGDGNDVINAGDGYDVVRSGGGGDVLDGGAGFDGLGRTFTNATQNIAVNLQTSVIGGVGGSIAGFEYFVDFTSGSGNDRFVSTGLALNDSLVTGGGNDTFTAYAGYDSYDAGLGADRLVIDWSAVTLGIGFNSQSQVADANGGWRGYYYISSVTRVNYTSVESFDLTGTIYDDQITTRDGADVLNGGAGNDRLDAGSGNDTIDGGAGLDGFAKNFTTATGSIVVDLTLGTIAGAATSIANVEYLLDVRTGSGNDRFFTLDLTADDVAWGGGGNDNAYFYAGSDRFEGGSGRDLLVVDYSALDTDAGISSSVSADSTNGGFRGYYYVDGNHRADFTGLETAYVTGTKNNDTINGMDGADRLLGLDGRDTINGGLGNDLIDGGLAADTLNGGTGDDTITGGGAGDLMTGGTGADTFIFRAGDTNNSVAYADRITDFNRTVDGDEINLSALDANTGVAGNQAFAFIGDTAFSAAGQLRVVQIAGVTYIQGNTDANLAADFIIRVDGETPIVTDFVL